jgi:uncharacterized alkaline shock family protein YloU
MDNQPESTIEMSLEVLSEVVAKAAEDLEAVHGVITRARDDIASRNTSISREVIVAATRAVDHLSRADEALNEVVRELGQI